MCDTIKCKSCEKVKPKTEEYFYPTKNGFRRICKICYSEKVRKNYHDNREEKLQYQKDRYYDKSEYLIEYQKQYNKDYSYQYHKKRLKTDSIYKVSHMVRSIILNSFKRKGWSKNTKTAKILGCDWITFKQHIKNQFQEGMTWDNHGFYGWHLDHHIPISCATTEEEVIKLNHYTNFRPLWAEDNMRKSDKISEEWGNVDLTV